ncbi:MULTISPECIES: flagellar motor switch protein FliM [Nocardioides]|uniref:Flagellar motor switch protein FliM n=1 Tax=Nocardioides lianchengensis TaxID=1045774 RepID=A0A1G6U2P0_9ACTN|nr:flagellar motor switch protein FliM [Nocardioides lianchengensis]NYG11570.1 flagellar motor switch protein FliM [Nocardioides lianchengensis]SDD34946.1 flagellar motor switch protein FliM [Nocardioides lianchengensis]
MSQTNPTFSGSSPGRPASRSRRRARTSEPVPYDFKRPVQLSREHQRILQLGFDTFARQAMTVFTSALRSVCHVEVTKVEQSTYHEYVDSLGGMTYMTLFTNEPMPGSGVLEIPLNAVMSCIDHMLGGPGSGRQPERPLTDIESGVIKGVVARLLGEMRYSLADIVSVEPEITGVEYSPQFAQVAGPADIVVVVRLELRIADRAHRMTVCLPFNGLLPHLTAAAAPAPVSNRERAERERAAGMLQGKFQTVPVDVSVRFRSTGLDSATLSTLQLGDVLRLAHPASAPLDVTVDDTVFAHATAGAQGPRLAALIVATPEESK